jgi:hypothetical protein
MNKNSKRELLSVDPLSDYFNERPFNIEDESPTAKRGKSIPNGGGSKVPPKISNLFNLQSLADAHITSVLLADQIIKEQK